MEKSKMPDAGTGKKSGGMVQLREAAAQLCRVLMLIAGDETQFYQREKRLKAGDAEAVEAAQLMDIKALKDMVESLKSLTRIVRDLEDLPDQPERHSQQIADAKLALAREQMKKETGISGITLEEGVEPYAQ